MKWMVPLHNVLPYYCFKLWGRGSVILTCVTIELYYLSSGAGSPRPKKNSSSIFRQFRPFPIRRIIIPIHLWLWVLFLMLIKFNTTLVGSLYFHIDTNLPAWKCGNDNWNSFYFGRLWCFSTMGPFTFNINDDTGQGQTGHTPQHEFAACFIAPVLLILLVLLVVNWYFKYYWYY